MSFRRSLSAWPHYATATLATGVALGARLLLRPVLGLEAPVTLFLTFAIMFSAYVGGLGPGLLSTALGALAIDYFFFGPVNAIGVAAPGEQARLALFAVEGVLLSVLAEGLHRSRRRAEAEGRAHAAQERRFHRLTETGNVIAWEADVETWAFTYIGEQAAAVLGYPLEQWYSPGFWPAHIHPEDRDWAVRFCKEMTARNEDHEFDYRMLAADGRVVWLHDAVSVLTHEDGHRSLYGFMFDITARKRAEEGLRRANQAKDQFLATLSHELRTPLTPVLATISLLQDQAAPGPELREDLEMIRRNVELEARLIDDLLDLTRISRGKLELHREAADVHELLRHAVRTCTDAMPAGKGPRVVLRPEAAQAHVWGDPARVQQVFWNLLNNALKFTPESGRIELRTDNPEPGRLRLRVADTGVGIESEQLPRLFTAFEQGGRAVTRQFGGLGLGLAICRAIVGLHGGTIQAYSAGKGQGATFTVELPVMSQPAPAGAPRPAIAQRPLTPPLRILLVEDHLDTARMLGQLLQHQGHQVQAATDAMTALALAEREPFDLIVSDLSLPGLDGCELMQRLRQRYPALKGIAVSGHGMDEDLSRSRQAGFEEHLTKPVDLPRLRGAIARVAGGAAQAIRARDAGA